MISVNQKIDNDFIKLWQWKKLSELANTTSGGTPRRNHLEYFQGNINWFKSGELKDAEIFDSEEKITVEAIKESNAKIFPKGTLLIAMYGATVGKLGLLGVEAATNQAICAIFPKKQFGLPLLNNWFLFYYFKYIRHQLINRSFGAAQPNISQTLIKETYIPIPFPKDIILSLDVQNRIVSRIESLLGELKGDHQLLDKMRRDTSRVMEATLTELINEIDKKYPDSPTIGELLSSKYIKILGGGTPSTENEEYWGGSIPWTSPRDMKRWYIDTTQKYISQTALQDKKLNIVPEGSVLIVVRGMILAHTLPVGVTKNEVTINQDMKALVPEKNLLSEYLGYILRARAPFILQQVETAAHGTRRLKTDTLKKVVIPIVSISEQRSIIEYLNFFQTKVHEMKNIMQQDAQLLERLEQSILEKAFQGQL
ncbi:Type I restriction modification DNA specificity domain protein [Coleofasciculus chthonoplastes PCC 7420]|uniref:Type I restriction modification DNA specificity domain protein n=1 Tax=Coleofasciculus chthonoplastes PCC 7420 TaxID=118168 RepID=B4VZI2_9CYAN|nr:restriction endonuclease subunit S [Coleofasciculus chthonoplastes]EDX72675.1 Type I restriction modification DNA specificity domain protein [Coleofasciculus chthonoplastes PCC 7420]